MDAATSPAFGALLSRYRLAAGLTQEELAERAALSARAIADLERGVHTRPQPRTVHHLAAALQLSAEERALFEQAARTAPPAADDPLAAPVRPTGHFLGAWPCDRLVAREEELVRVQALLDAVVDGTGQVILLAGELGLGKTRLAQEVMVAAHQRGFMIGAGRCYRREAHPAYAPLLEALDDLVTHVPAAGHAAIQAPYQALQQQLQGGATAPGRGMSSATEQHLHRAVASLLVTCAASGPVALLLDDLHWADEGTVTLLAHLARSTRAARVVLLATLRDSQLSEDHPALAQVLQDLGRERLLERIGVRRLVPEETTALVAALMGQAQVSEELAAFIHRRSKGTPRFIEQLARALGGRLQLRREIGAGAMGRVFEALDAKTGTTVAAKLMLARGATELESLLRFQQEGAVLAALVHPHIVRIHDTFVEEHASCIIMELLDGPSLGQLLRDGPLPLPRAKRLAVQVAAALSYVHAQGIVHRDIKPDNVMVVGEDHIKVTDFGIARLLRPDSSLQTIATTGMRLGTPLYMAPEQIQGQKIDGRTDIYAFGALLYHMVTGQPPFVGADALAVAVRHLQEEPAPPSALKAGVPVDWDALILRALHKDPARRFPSAKEMEGAIVALSEDGGTPARRQVRERTRRGAALAGLLLVLVGAVWAYAGVAPRPSSLSTRLDTYLGGLAAHQRFSGTALVARRGTLVLSKGYGLADREHRVANGPSTIFPLSGLEATLSVLAALQLEERGRLADGARICAYLRSCPAAWRPITVHMVLAGTAHLPPLHWGGTTGSERQSLAACAATPLDPLPRGRANYEACTVLVLGAIVERVTGQPWATVLRRSILTPAGMAHTGRLTNALQPPQRARDYIGVTTNTESSYDVTLALYATAPDVLRFDEALFGGKLAAPRTLAAMLAPRDAATPAEPGIADPRRGYFWKVGRLLGHRLLYTAGTMDGYAPGFATYNMRFPDDGVTVVVVDNDAQDETAAVAVAVARLVFGASVPPPSPSGPIPTVDAARAIQATIDTRTGAALPAIMGGRIWLANAVGILTWIDTRTNGYGASLRVGDPGRFPLSLYQDGDPLSVATGDGQVWTLDAADKEAVRLDPATAAIRARVPVGVLGSDLAIAGGSLWVEAYRNDRVVRVDVRTNRVVATIATLHQSTDIAAGDGAVWISTKDGMVQRIDPARNRVVASIPAGSAPEALALDGGAMWVQNRLGDHLSRVDPRTNSVVATIPFGPASAGADGPCCRGVAVGAGAVWAIAQGTGQLVRIDPQTNRAVAALTLPVPAHESQVAPADVMIGDGSLWVYADPHYLFRIDPRAML